MSFPRPFSVIEAEAKEKKATECRLAQQGFRHDPNTCAWCKHIEKSLPPAAIVMRRLVLEEAARIRRDGQSASLPYVLEVV